MGRISLGKNMAGGEPAFVARDPMAMAAKRCPYDDGYLVLYATHSVTMASYCLVCFLESLPTCFCANIENFCM